MEIERKLARLIEKGDFDPTQNNLEALRIGSTVASSSLKILRKYLEGADVKGIFDPITRLLRSHLGQAAELHNAALLSLTHAATLLTLIAPATATAPQDGTDSFPAPPASPEPAKKVTKGQDTKCDLNDMLTVPSLLLQLTTDPHRPKLVTSLAATTVIFYNLRKERTQWEKPDHTTWTEGVLRGLVERYAEGKITFEWIANIKSLSIALAEQDDSAKYMPQLERIFLSEYQAATLLTLPTVEIEPEKQNDQTFQEGLVSSNLSALWAIHSLRPATAPSPALYLSLVKVMCRTPPSSPLFACGAQMLSKCPFLTLSKELATALEQQDLVPLLGTASTSHNETKRYFAWGQLWLLLSLYIYAGDTASEQDTLKVQLDKCRRNGDESEERRHRYLGRHLYSEVQTGNNIARELGVWGWRLEECVRRCYRLDIAEYIHEALRNVPPELRGMSSFTAWPRRAGNPSTNKPQAVKGLTDEVRARTDATNVTTEGRGATGRDGHLPSAGLVEEAGEAKTQGEDGAGREDSSQHQQKGSHIESA